MSRTRESSWLKIQTWKRGCPGTKVGSVRGAVPSTLRMTLQANQLSNLFPGTCCLLPESYDFFRREERKSSSRAPKANSISLEVLFETHDCCTRKSNSILIQDYPPTKTAGSHTVSHTESYMFISHHPSTDVPINRKNLEPQIRMNEIMIINDNLIIPTYICWSNPLWMNVGWIPFGWIHFGQTLAPARPKYWQGHRRTLQLRRPSTGDMGLSPKC